LRWIWIVLLIAFVAISVFFLANNTNDLGNRNGVKLQMQQRDSLMFEIISRHSHANSMARSELLGHSVSSIVKQLDLTNWQCDLISIFDRNPDNYLGVVFHEENPRRLFAIYWEGEKEIPKDSIQSCRSLDFLCVGMEYSSEIYELVGRGPFNFQVLEGGKWRIFGYFDPMAALDCRLGDRPLGVIDDPQKYQ